MSEEIATRIVGLRLGERVKSGELTPSEALALLEPLPGGLFSRTWRWLKRRGNKRTKKEKV